MRVFYALTFDESSRSRLYDLALSLAPTPFIGRVTRAELLHLTLLFLGEVGYGAIVPLRDTLDTLSPIPTTYACSAVGSFKKRYRRILYAAIEPAEPLIQTSLLLAKAVEALGYPFDPAPLTAHVTLVRDVRRFVEIPFTPFPVEVEDIVLLHSCIQRGRLIYTPLATYPL